MRSELCDSHRDVSFAMKSVFCSEECPLSWSSVQPIVIKNLKIEYRMLITEMRIFSLANQHFGC